MIAISYAAATSEVGLAGAFRCPIMRVREMDIVMTVELELTDSIEASLHKIVFRLQSMFSSSSKYDFVSKKWSYLTRQYCCRKIKTGYDFNFLEFLPS